MTDSTHTISRRPFNHDMARDTEVQVDIISAYDFSCYRHIYDIGGGYGALTKAILLAYPNLYSTILETPAVVPAAIEYINAANLTDRCKVVSGDFFHMIPAGGDIYIFKNIIHDWDDKRAKLILSNCRRTLLTSAKVLIMEQILNPDDTYSPVHYMNLAMLVLTGGKERTLNEYNKLLMAASLQLSRVISTRQSFSIIESVPI